MTGGGTLVLDSQGLALYLEQDRAVLNLVRSALDRGANRVISAVTVVEGRHAGIKAAHWDHVLSHLDIKPLSVAWAKQAAQLLHDNGLHGHTHAIDAMVAVTALHQPGPVVLLTSDVPDMAALCGEHITLVHV